MTKKHFEAIADALASVRPDRYAGVVETQYLEARRQWGADVATLANVCERENIRFDRRRFIDACESR
jgi:hypothetical protein